MRPRIIPVLSLSNGGLVKTTKFKNPKYVGDPTNAIRIFNDKEVDELIVVDITASKNGSEPDFEVIRLFAEECFMPLTYGGGIRTLSQATRIFDLGIEKVSLQTAALDDLSLISALARKYGQQSVVLSVDIKRDWRRKPWVYCARTRKLLTANLSEYIQARIDAGAGEILLNSVDHDGVMDGYDLDLIKSVASSVAVPLIALGGAGSAEHLKNALRVGASAAAAGALFVFKGPHRAVLINYPKEIFFELQ
ncbi:AglZ/HisF2 family acetamidino modification protein [Pusillimonas sp. ANT_WB101]|uniref:AglZ/HisF2 family acetamidino modification protein n=1 Tax=Pusillimonas sp. ANT_WB101 TaxID=2597356 RepID=UPI0011ED4CF4|nr:AglZ/HisF2 family acetamidino modification protein [Pusillimonas sp. ANT_WB101]KAA0889515.1 imidazole glycerol phosphate synthase subunit HisF [Pusillimonas sp. ANT_WB101]